ncbi:hypothetical protein Ahy_A07g034440 [Arachis hypogaea]|uniref:Uncharacterized protein n=1 Tax=Arachis hypogaea TaxID=3818 RepID=A0A445CBX0_ARAHY|nr:hypothetical protein Ahy_A07g034440 [Arachis hypogaea]
MEQERRDHLRKSILHKELEETLKVKIVKTLEVEGLIEESVKEDIKEESDFVSKRRPKINLMENGATSKRKRLVKKYQAHAKVKEFEMKDVSSAAKLVRNFITKGDKGSNQAKIAQQPKRKISEIGDKQSRENSMEERNKTLVDNVMNWFLRSSHNQVRSNIQLEEQPIPKKMKSKAKCSAMALDVFLHTEGVEVEREEEDDFESIGEDARATEKEPANLTNLKNNLKRPAMTLDAFLGDQGIHVEREEEHTEVSTTEDARSRPSPNNGENVHIPYEKDYIGEHESDNFIIEGDQVMEEAHVEGDDKLHDLQEDGETPTNAFQKVFGKENPRRKNKEIDEIKKQSEEKVTALKTELDDHKQRLQGLEDIVKLMLQQTSPGMNVDETLSLLRSKKSSANSAQDPNLLSYCWMKFSEDIKAILGTMVKHKVFLILSGQLSFFFI